MQFELMASMMCADYGSLEKEVKNLEEGGIDSFHIDIMDGRYVPNFAMSLNDMRYRLPAKRRHGLYSSGSRIPPIHYAAKHHQCRTDSRDCHQSRNIRGDGHGNAADCEKGFSYVCKSRECRTDVFAICRKEDYKIACLEGRYGL